MQWLEGMAQDWRPFYEKRWQRPEKARKIRQQKLLKHNRAELEKEIGSVRSGRNRNTLMWIVSDIERYRPNYEDSFFDKITERYGLEISEATREGLKIFWKTEHPPFRYETGNFKTYSILMEQGLGSLNLAVKEGLDIGALDQELTDKAVRYATYELNGFPIWLDILADRQPDLVRNCLSPVIAADCRLTKKDGYPFDILRNLPWAARSIRKVCSPVLLEQLKSSKKASI